MTIAASEWVDVLGEVASGIGSLIADATIRIFDRGLVERVLVAVSSNSSECIGRRNEAVNSVVLAGWCAMKGRIVGRCLTTEIIVEDVCRSTISISGFNDPTREETGGNGEDT